MKRWSWLNLALIVAVCALALFAYYKPAKTEPEHKLSALKAADATTIKVEIAGNPPFALSRAGSEWKITAPGPTRADGIQVQRVRKTLEGGEKALFPAPGLARYDLNKPPVRVTVNQQTFGFGAINQMSRE